MRLMLMRHGKSDWNTDVRGDLARPLNSRGERAAATMGVVLEKMGEVPDRIVSSPAVRAETTATIARTSGGWSAPVEVSEGLYGGGPAETLAIAAAVGADAHRLMLVGHEPTWSLLARHLTGGRVIVKTGTVLAFDLDATAWSEAERCHGALAYALHPKMFDEEWNLR